MADETFKCLPFTPFDQVMPRVYVRLCFGFAFPRPSERAHATAALRATSQRMLEKCPVAAATIAPCLGDDGEDHGFLQLRYAVSPPEDLCFVVKHHTTADLPWTYEQLTASGAPPAAVVKENLSSLSEHPRPSESSPAFGLQVNFLSGGLILCFAFHHALFDGQSITMFLEMYAEQIREHSSAMTPSNP